MPPSQGTKLPASSRHSKCEYGGSEKPKSALVEPVVASGWLVIAGAVCSTVHENVAFAVVWPSASTAVAVIVWAPSARLAY